VEVAVVVVVMGAGVVTREREGVLVTRITVRIKRNVENEKERMEREFEEKSTKNGKRMAREKRERRGMREME
jgi:hypothetical protein